MAQQTTMIDEGIERVRDTYRSAEESFEKLQDRVSQSRTDLQEKIEEQGREFQKQIRRIPGVKRAETLADDVQKQIETNVDSFLGRLPVASQSDIDKLDKKVRTLNRKLRALEKAHGQV